MHDKWHEVASYDQKIVSRTACKGKNTCTVAEKIRKPQVNKYDENEGTLSQGNLPLISVRPLRSHAKQTFNVLFISQSEGQKYYSWLEAASIIGAGMVP